MFYPTTCVGFGTGLCRICLEGFLGSLITIAVGLAEASPYCPVSSPRVDLPAHGLTTRFNALFRQCAGVSLLRRRIAPGPGNGMLTVCPSHAPRGSCLGPD